MNWTLVFTSQQTMEDVEGACSQSPSLFLVDFIIIISPCSEKIIIKLLSELITLTHLTKIVNFFYF